MALRAVFEARAVHAGGFERVPVHSREIVVAELAEKRGAQSEPGGVERGVGGGSARGVRRLALEQSDDALHLVVIDEHHAAFFTRDMSLAGTRPARGRANP